MALAGLALPNARAASARACVYRARGRASAVSHSRSSSSRSSSSDSNSGYRPRCRRTVPHRPMIIRERRLKLRPQLLLAQYWLGHNPPSPRWRDVRPQDATVTAEGGSLRAAREVSTIRGVNLACAISSGSRRRSVTVRFTAAAAYLAYQEAVRHLSNSRDWLIFFQIFLYKPV